MNILFFSYNIKEPGNFLTTRKILVTNYSREGAIEFLEDCNAKNIKYMCRESMRSGVQDIPAFYLIK